MSAERHPDDLGPDQRSIGTQATDVGSDSLPAGQRAIDAHRSNASGDPSQRPTSRASATNHLPSVADPLPAGHGPRETQRHPAGGDPSQRPTEADPAPIVVTSVADSLLLIYADALDDLEEMRMRMANRVRALEQVKGMAGAPEHARMAGLVDGLQALENGVLLDLKRTIRKHPLGPWIKQTIGVGEKQGARLLATIGDPTTRRTVSQLWAYSGYHVLPAGHAQDETPITIASGDPSSNPGHARKDAQISLAGVAPTRRKGQKANWNPDAKSRAFLIAESCIKQAKSPYRAVYDAGRDKYRDAVHPAACQRCGPKGKPAQPGSPLSLGHQHARAMRLVSKAILRDIWVEARRVRFAGQDLVATHSQDVGETDT